MGRRKRKTSTPCCYHITHWCLERKFFLKFEIDRKNFCQRLREMTQKYPVDVLDYMVTCNHIHLLLWSKHARDVSQGMHYLAGNTSRDYNRRKKREGAFWRGRYHPTLIEDGAHLARCLFYIDLNMVRAGRCLRSSPGVENLWLSWTGRKTSAISNNKSRSRTTMFASG